MSTKSLIDRLAPYCNNWSRSGTSSILSLIEEGQDDFLNIDANFPVFIDNSNKGFPPYLKTTSGTYVYSISNANLSTTLVKNIAGTDYVVRARRGVRLFVDTTSTDYDRKYLGEPALSFLPNPYSVSSSRMFVSPVPADFYPALESTDATVTFKEDPGTTTTTYFIEFIWLPPRLTSESIPLIVPQQYEKALEYYVIGRIQELSNGKVNDFMVRYEQMKSTYRAENVSMLTSNNKQTPTLIC